MTRKKIATSFLRQRAVVAVIAFVLATTGTLLLWDAVFERVPFALYFAAVALTAWRAGWRAGIAVAIAGMVAVNAHQQFPIDLIVPSVVLIGVSACIGLIATARDRALSALYTSERQYRLMVENVRDYAVFMTDVEGRVTKWNAGAERVLGWRDEEIVGRSASLIFTPEDRAAGADGKEMETALRDGCAADKRWHQRKNGSRFFANGMLMRADDEAGRHVGFTKVLREETERRLADARQATQLAVAAVLAEAADLEDAVPKLLQAICEASGWCWGALWRVDKAEGVLLLADRWTSPAEGLAEFEEASRRIRLPRGTGLPGRAWAAGEPTWVSDVSADENFPRREVAARAGLHGALCFPVSWRGEVLALMEFFSAEVRPPDRRLLDMMAVVGGQVGQFIDRKTTEGRLRASEARHAAGVAAALDCIVSMDHRGLVTDWNPAAERTFGYTRGEALGRELADLIIPPALREAHRHGLARYLGTGEGPVIGKRFEITAVRNGGTEFPVELSITRLPSQGLPEFTGYLRDITEQKRAEATLRESEGHARRIIDNTLAFVGVMTPDGTLTEANAMALRAGGLRREDVVGKKFWDCHWWSYDSKVQAGLRAAVDRAAGGEVVRYDVTVRTAGDTRMPIDFMLSPVRDELGRVTHLIPSGVDIAERRRAEEERQTLLESEQAARSESERAGRMKDEFLATLSHELRTPLSAILGWSQILRRPTAKPETLAEGLGTIERNARVQVQIIEDLLDMSRIISGKIALNSEQTNLATVAGAAVQTVGPAANAKQIKVSFAAPSDALYPVLGDPSRLQQVFWNLLSNAIKFTPRGGDVRLTIDRRESHWQVDVTDSGEGISSEFLPYVFEKFRQQDGSTTRRHGGLGLGLAIVKQLVELHGGTVGVSSVGPGHGATFTVLLPVSAVRAGATKAPEASGGDHGDPATVEVASPSLSVREGFAWDASGCDDLDGTKVLVVDDEADARALLVRLLSDCKANVMVAGSADEAIELVERERPDVLVSDIGMPGDDGYALLRRVRELGPSRGGSVPAIALTAYARAEDRVKAVRAGFQMHVPKPVEPAELIAMIASLVRRGNASG